MTGSRLHCQGDSPDLSHLWSETFRRSFPYKCYHGFPVIRLIAFLGMLLTKHNTLEGLKSREIHYVSVLDTQKFKIKKFAGSVSSNSSGKNIYFMFLFWFTVSPLSGLFCYHRASSLCVSVFTCILLISHHYARSEGQPTAIKPNLHLTGYICNDSISKLIHILRFWELQLQYILFLVQEFRLPVKYE